MSFLKAIFTFYINSSIHVSLAVCSLCGVTFIAANLELNLVFFSFIFLSTITGYNFVKYAGVAKLYHKRLTPRLKGIQIFSFIAFAGLIFTCFYLPRMILVACLILAGLTALYALPVFPKEKSLRRISGIKIYIIAFVWASTTSLLPLVFYSQELNIEDSLRFLQHFLFVLSITLPFEIRDLKYDQNTLNTIPQQIGIKNTKILSICLLLAVILLDALMNYKASSMPLITTVVVLISALLIINNKVGRSRYFTAFWIESLPILWFVLLALYDYLF